MSAASCERSRPGLHRRSRASSSTRLPCAAPRHPLRAEFLPDRAHVVDAEVVIEDPLDLYTPGFITLGASGLTGSIGPGGLGPRAARCASSLGTSSTHSIQQTVTWDFRVVTFKR